MTVPHFIPMVARFIPMAARFIPMAKLNVHSLPELIRTSISRGLIGTEQ